jgi:hypothetical protein
MRGGKREGAGRPTSSKNRRTVTVETAMQIVAERFKAEVPMAFDGDGVAYLQTVYRDPQQPTEFRMDAAAKAARYERPALAAPLTKDVTMAVTEAPDSRPPIGAFLIEFGKKVINGEIVAEGFALSAADQGQVPNAFESRCCPMRPQSAWAKCSACTASRPTRRGGRNAPAPYRLLGVMRGGTTHDGILAL